MDDPATVTTTVSTTANSLGAPYLARLMPKPPDLTGVVLLRMMLGRPG